MLNYIYNFKDKIKYIIYFYEENFEVIKVENIPDIYKQLKNDYLILPRSIIEIHKISNTLIRFNLRSEDEQN